MKKIIISGVLLMMLCSVALARGGDKDCDNYRDQDMGRGGYHKMFKHMNLTEKQEDLIYDIKKVYKRKIIPLDKDKRALRKEFAAEISSEVVNKENVKSIVKRMGKLSTRLHLIKLEEMFELQDVLTPKQKKQMKKIRKEAVRHRRRD